MATATPTVEKATPIRRLFANILDWMLFFLTLIIGYFIWWLIVLARGQTPGKQLLGIYAIKPDGSRAGWGTMFAREVIKLIAHSSTVGFFADAILLLLDDEKHRSLSDRVVNTIMVRGLPRQSEVVGAPEPDYLASGNQSQ